MLQNLSPYEYEPNVAIDLKAMADRKSSDRIERLPMNFSADEIRDMILEVIG